MNAWFRAGLVALLWLVSFFGMRLWHGLPMRMVTTHVAFGAVDWTIPYWLALVVDPFSYAAYAAAMHLTVLRPTSDTGEILLALRIFVITFGFYCGAVFGAAATALFVVLYPLLLVVMPWLLHGIADLILERRHSP